MKHLQRGFHPIITIGGGLIQNWNNVDGGGDFWLYLPQAVESEGAKYLPKEQTSDALVEIEQRYTSFDNNAATMQEGDTSYVEIKSTAAGSKIVMQNMAYADPAANPTYWIKDSHQRCRNIRVN